MQVLLIDDEVMALDGMKCIIDWHEIGITELFTANCAMEAKNILRKEKIDIVISDIEMPIENGLDLLRWMRNERYQAENIFLTCHEDFKYAREALVLGSTDYLLKPVDPEELIKAVKKTRNKLNLRKKEEVEISFAEKMKKNKIIFDHIWYCNLVQGKLGTTRREIIEECKEHNISLNEENKVMFVYFVIKGVGEPFRFWETEIYDFVFTNVAEECLDLKISEKVFSYAGADRHNDTYGAIVMEKNHSLDDVTEGCRKFVNWMKNEYGTTISCYVDDFIYVDELYKQAEKLCHLDKNSPFEEPFVFMCNNKKEPIPQRKNHEKLWEILWREDKTDIMLERIHTMMETYRLHGLLTSQNMEVLIKDVTAIAFNIMKNNKFDINLLWQQEEFYSLFKEAHKSIENAMKLFNYLVKKEKDICVVENKEDRGTIVEQVRSYITQHINEEITRTKLSEQVHLNKDYLNRIFKKETGKSLSEYIVEEKMNVAKELLIMTDMPIGDIGYWVGYHNFSHFSSYFKKFTGYSAAVYRSKFRQDK